ncbi:MAG: hypothetical protein ACI4M9_00965 [Succinivibrio sp.]
MINLNTNAIGTSNTVNVTSKTPKIEANEVKSFGNHDVNTGASVVSLQGKNVDASDSSSVKITAENAHSMVADITAMLLKTDGSFQEGISGFDAARLLS